MSTSAETPLKPRFQPPARNAAPGGSAASKRGGASTTSIPSGRLGTRQNRIATNISR
ncbi:hypothetical protein [uncultured Nostoc sp.]|uniref:hypothetical protein n=1 Tax=uncultured Nostoc sp. TaxID=340711 RepID=UPI0035C9E6C1